MVVFPPKPERAGRWLAAFLAAIAFGPSALASEVFDAGLRTETEREAGWLRVAYRYQNVEDRRIGAGSVRCFALDEEGEVVAKASDRITNADVPFGVQLGVVVLKVGAAQVRARCDVEVSYWIVDGAYVAAEDPEPAAEDPESLAEVTQSAEDGPESADNGRGPAESGSAEAVQPSDEGAPPSGATSSGDS